MKYNISSVAFGVLILSSICYSKQTLTVDDLLARYDQTQKNMQSKYIKSETIREYRDSWSEKSDWYIERSEFYTDGTRIDLTIRNWIPIRDKNDRDLPDFGHVQVVWDKDSWYEYHELEEVKASQVVISKKEDTNKGFVSIAYPGACLEGFFPGDIKTVSSIFHEATQVRLYDKKENINGVQCHVLEATTEYGRHKIWIDPEHGYNICQAEVSKEKGDLYNGKLVYRTYPNWKELGVKLPKGKIPLPTSPRIGTAFKLTNVKFQKYNDIWMPVSADYEKRTMHENGRVRRLLFSYTVNEVDLSPNFEDAQAFVPHIRNGTRAILLDEENHVLDYHWVDGRIEPDVDDSVLKSIDETLEELIEESPNENNISSPEAEQITKEHTHSIDKPEDIRSEKDMSTTKPIESETYDEWGSLLGRVTFFALGSVIVLGSIGFLVLRIKRSKKNV